MEKQINNSCINMCATSTSKFIHKSSLQIQSFYLPNPYLYKQGYLQAKILNNLPFIELSTEIDLHYYYYVLQLNN